MPSDHPADNQHSLLGVRGQNQRSVTAVAAAITLATTSVVAGSVAFLAAPASAAPCSSAFGNFASLLTEGGAAAGMGRGGLPGPFSGSVNGSNTGIAGISAVTENARANLKTELTVGPLATAATDLVRNAGVFGAKNLPHWVVNETAGTVPILQGPTQIVQLLTGPTSPDQTIERFGISGTDLGIMWDGGQGDTLMAFGDTMGDCSVPGNQWRSNVLLRSSDRDLANGLQIDSAAMEAPGLAKSIIPRSTNGDEITLIPTSGVSVNGRQYLRFMSVRQWGAPSQWTTNFSGLAHSDDNGENWTVDPASTRAITNSTAVPADAPRPDSTRWFDKQMSSYLRHDGYVYEYLTPSGRFGSVVVARVPESEILEPAAYQWWNGHTWSDDLHSAKTVIEAPVSELSVTWNDYLNKFVAMFAGAGASVGIKLADSPTGPWSQTEALLTDSHLPGIYGGFQHPWSNGSDLYYLVTTWDSYNVYLVKSDISALAANGLRSMPEFNGHILERSEHVGEAMTDANGFPIRLGQLTVR